MDGAVSDGSDYLVLRVRVQGLGQEVGSGLYEG